MVSQTSESSAPTTMSMLAAPANPWTSLLEVCAIGNACTASAPRTMCTAGQHTCPGRVEQVVHARERAACIAPRVEYVPGLVYATGGLANPRANERE